jgi:hypothetical protein
MTAFNNNGFAMKTIFELWCAAALSLGLVCNLSAASTPGTATFNVQLSQDGGNYAPKHVVAVWVTTASGTFIKTLRRDGNGWNGEGTSHLTQWQNAKAGSTVIDGYTGSTITTYNPFTVTWNGTNASGGLAADGDYKFWVEFTEANAQGPYTAGGITWTKGATVYSNTYPDQAYIKNMKVLFTPAVPTHDIAVTGFSPSTAQTNANVSVTVTVTNSGNSSETFGVVLSNLTTASLVGTQQVSALAGHTLTNLSFRWSTTNLALGAYQFQATAGPVPGETNTANNTLTATITVQIIPHDLALLGLSPDAGLTNVPVALRVLVTNKTSTVESFAVVLSNLTSSSLISTQWVNGLAGNTASNLNLAWIPGSLPPGAYLLLATAGPVPGEAGTADNVISNLFSLQQAVHDVGIVQAVAPWLVLSNSTTNLTVIATNRGTVAEWYNVQLFDDTAGRRIGSNQINNLKAATGTNLTFAWRTTNVVLGYHGLRAVASPVAGEGNLLDNTNFLAVPVALGLVTNTLIASGTVWNYSDTETDLSQTPWMMPGYYDNLWAAGPSPLGYGYPIIATTNSYGPDANNKHPTIYYRRAFNLDFPPLSLSLRCKRDDGIVIYLNGAELVRNNMPTGAVAFATLSTTNNSGSSGNFWITSTVGPTNVWMGANQLAAEVHQNSTNSNDLLFDLDLTAISPLFPIVHDLDVVSVVSPEDALAGDSMPITVTLTNTGNVTDTAWVFLKDLTSGQIIGSNSVNNLKPGGNTSLQFRWSTLGASNGAHTLQAYTVVGGFTNFAGAGTGPALISGTGISLNAVGANGAVGGRCAAVATTSNLLLVGAGATLEVWNRTTPSAPVKLGQMRLPGLIEGLAVSGSFAYAACGNAGVQFVDLARPEAPVHMNTYDTSGHACQVAVNSNYLYIADGIAGVRVVDVTSPAAPVVVGAFYTEGPARGVAISGAWACVLDGHKGLLVLSLANPIAPTLVGAYPGINAAQALAVSGSYAYIVDANNHFYVVNVGTPSAPILTASLLLPNAVGQAVVLNGVSAYVPAGDAGLMIINLATPSAPTLAGTLATPGQAVAGALGGTTLYLADGFWGFQVYNAATPAIPTLQADVPTAIRACDVVAQDNLAYVAAGEGGLRIYSVTNPAAPAWVGWFAGATNARCLALSGTTAYVGDGQYGLKIVNVANPGSPSALGAWSGPELASIRNLGATGSLVLASDGCHVCLFDTTTPNPPLLKGVYSTPAFAFDLTVAGSRAYLACGSAGLIILDLSAGSLVQRSITDTPGLATGVSVSGNRAFLADGPNGWLVFDVSNPDAPVLLQTNSAQGPVFGVAVSGVLATLGSGANSATSVDVSAPLTPVPKVSFNALVRALRISAGGGKVYVSEDEAGLAILGNPEDMDSDGLPDAWEQQIIAASQATNGPVRTIWDVNPNDDFDGDGLSNYAEYVAGTSPIDPASTFTQYAPHSAGGATITLRWHSAPGKTYTLWKSANLAAGPAGFAVVQDNIPATPPLNSLPIPTSGGAGLYIISVR